jgi:hypothetical protein
MGKKTNAKKIVKILGNILSVIAIIYIIRKFIKMDIDPGMLLSGKALFVCLVLVLLQVSQILTASYPWLQFVRILSNKRIAFKESMLVYAKANIYKYVPGNVFHFVARNELAVKENVSHLDVAASTVLDTVCSLGISFLLSVVLLRNAALEYMKNYAALAKVLLVILLVCILAAVVLLYLFRAKLTNVIANLKRCFKKENLRNLLCIFVYDVYNNMVNVLIYTILLLSLFAPGFDGKSYTSLMGAYLLSILIGMITPGASGGIGIRETVMLVLTQNHFSESMIVSSMVIIRVVSIVADIVAFLFQMIIEKMGNKYYNSCTK